MSQARSQANERTDATTRIGGVARQLGLTPRALRYWEQRGLLPPAARSDGGTRVYRPEHVSAVRGVVSLKRAGFSLDEICSIQDSLRRSRTALEGTRDLAAVLADREEQLGALIKELQLLLADLTAAREAVLRCDGCHGKTYDHECIDCLETRNGGKLPCSLRSLMAAAASSRPEGST
jgi:DNA-binding transcriptional MerR regulator